MKQEPTETIEQFAFRFKNVLHQLDKLGESLTKHCPTYSIAQFISRVHPQISQHFIVKAEEFKQLDKTIEAARRIEQSFKMHEVKESDTDNNLSSSLSDWKPLGALSTQPTKGGIRNVPEKNPVKACSQCGDPSHLQRSCPPNKPVQQRPQLPPPKPEICRNYNRFLTSHCEQSNNKCSAGRLHKCLECNKWGCKALRHQPNLRSNPPNSVHPSSNFCESHNPVYPAQPHATAGATKPCNTQPNSSSRSDPQIFGLPAVTNPQGVLQSRHILWAPVSSAGVKLPLPIDSCCSVSLVSQAHADIVISKRPDLEFENLEEPIPVSVADARSKLSAIATMQIPIVWDGGKESIFTMLVVPQLSWPILFGENHLHSTKALVDHAVPSIEFRHPSMQFMIKCSLEKPQQAF